MNDSQGIAKHFTKAAHVYEKLIDVQLWAVKKMVKQFVDLDLILPQGAIVDLGAGTGVVSQEIVNYFPNRQLIATDISQAMLSQIETQTWFQQTDRVATACMNINEPNFSFPVSMFVSSFAWQWVNDPIKTIYKYWERLLPQGVLLLSFPDVTSYPEWRAVCEDLQIPFQGNILPNIEEMATELQQTKGVVKWDCFSYIEKFDDIMLFFKNLKQIGADYSYNRAPYSASIMRKIISKWNTEYQSKVTYKVGWLCFIKTQ